MDKIINGIDENNISEYESLKTKKKSKKSKKEKYNEKTKKFNELDEDDPELDNADESLLDSIFDFNIEKITKKIQLIWKKTNICKKTKRELIIKNVKPISTNKEYMIYEEFIKENNIDLKEIFILEVNNADKLNIKRNKEIFEKFLKTKIYVFRINR